MRCFIYNNTIIFAVPENLISKAIGEGGKNVRVIQETLGKKIKIVFAPRSVDDAQRFLQEIVEPVQFRSIEVTDKELVIDAPGQSKALLIGRNKIRLLELAQIVNDSFGKELKIV
jgi:transcription antitermination factor NusA-like protein